MKINRSLFVLFLIIALLFCGCKDSDGEEEVWPAIENNAKVTQVNFSDVTQTVNFSNLSNNSIFLVKVNTSRFEVDAPYTGGVNTSYYGDIDRKKSNISLSGLPLFNHEGAAGFNANPPSIIKYETISRKSMSIVGDKNSVGSTHDFWVEAEDEFVQKTATLQAIGAYCKVWVIPDENQNKTITQDKAQILASKFDIIYPAVTNILGYEYGGGPQGDGGRDNDPKIQILVYDIGGGIAGYFWGKDYYEDSHLPDGMKSNLAEIMYIDAGTVNEYADFAYSTLAHELQHMINFNQKALKTGNASRTWYDEMLSMMTEDVIASFLNISPSNINHVIRARIPLFLYSYDLDSITNWLPGDLFLISYSQKYAYGAYLLRNYGGADLLKEIISNDYVNEASITAALNKAYPDRGYDFEYTFKRFAEALIYTAPVPAGAMSFDKTVISNINGRTYISHGFNIWGDFSDVVLDFGNGHTFKCDQPYIYNLNQEPMLGQSIIIHSDNAWLNKSGNFSVTLNKPDNTNINLFMMVK